MDISKIRDWAEHYALQISTTPKNEVETKTNEVLAEITRKFPHDYTRIFELLPQAIEREGTRSGNTKYLEVKNRILALLNKHLEKPTEPKPPQK